jgi:hypothetical protein
MSDSSSAPRPIFTDAELRSAFDALDTLIQNEELPPAKAYLGGGIIEGDLVQELRQQGITFALAAALLDRMIGEGVIREGAKKVFELHSLTTSLAPDATTVDTGSRCWRVLFIDPATWYAHRSRRPQSDEPQPDTLTVAPGGFTLFGKLHRLSGKPLDVLRMLLAARHRCCTAGDLQSALWDPEGVLSEPRQAVKDTASKLRNALRAALRSTGFNFKGRPEGYPLVSDGRGKDLNYTLHLPPERPDER